MRRRRWQVVHAPPHLEPFAPKGLEVIGGEATVTPVYDRGPENAGYMSKADAIWALITAYEDAVDRLHRQLADMDEND